MSKIHILKTMETAWDAIAAGAKPFEVRRNDRFYQRGDVVVLRKVYEPGSGMTPGSYVMTGGKPTDLARRIGWMLQGGQFGIEPGYCVFALEPLESAEGAAE